MKFFPCHTLLNYCLPSKLRKNSPYPNLNEMLRQLNNFTNYQHQTHFLVNWEMIEYFVNLTCIGENLQNQIEKENLYTTWFYISWLIYVNLSQDSESKGWLDIEWIKEMHCYLMKNLIDENVNTKAGCFSIAPRSTTYNGHEHNYPWLKNEKEWFDAIQPIIDRFNALIQHIKLNSNSNNKIVNICKCAAYILYHIVSLHPFSDGNGRLSRFLACYTLLLFCPFPCAIFDILDAKNIFTFIDSIVFARDTLNKEPDISHLTVIIIESVWFSYIIYFSKMLLLSIKSMKK